MHNSLMLIYNIQPVPEHTIKWALLSNKFGYVSQMERIYCPLIREIFRPRWPNNVPFKCSLHLYTIFPNVPSIEWC